MFSPNLLFSRKVILPSLLLLLTFLCAMAGAPASDQKSPPAGTTASKTSTDPFVGAYVGTLNPRGSYVAKPKPEEGTEFKAQKCGNCHTEAKIARTETGYSLTLFVEHGKDKEGKPRKDQFTLKADRQDKVLSFSNKSWSINVTGDEATGKHHGRMAAELKLKRKPIAAE